MKLPFNLKNEKANLPKNGLIRKINFKTCDVTVWLTNNYNIYIAQFLTK